MRTECSPALFELAPVESRAVVAGFGGGAITSDAGALLFGAAAWIVCRVAVWHAARTQEYFDVMQAVRVQLRRDAGNPARQG